MPRRPASAIAEEFEAGVRAFLERCAFDDVNGGRGFRLGEQIDALAGFEDTLIIIECTTGSRAGKPLLDEIKLLRGKMTSIQRAAEDNEVYQKYTEFRYAIAVNFDVRSVDEEEARKEPTVSIWDRTYLEYYADLFRKIGTFAKFNLLGELDIRPRVTHSVQVPSFKIAAESTTAYLFYADPREILKWAYVARREIGREKYYQRLVEAGRLKRIADYIDQGGYFPNAAIVAFNVQPEFKRFAEVREHFPQWTQGVEFGSLSFPATFRSCWIVDGQHRLYGMAKALNPTTALMPIVALEGATVEDQAQLFLDINKTQKPVPSDLVWDLEGEMRPNSREGIISRVAKALNEEGPLAERIYVPLEGPHKHGQLKLSGICSAIRKRRITDRVLEHKFENPLYEEDAARLVRRTSHALNSSLQAADQVFDEWQKEGFWFQNTGIAIFMALYERILSHCKHVPSETELRTYLGPVKGHMERYRGSEQMKGLRQRCNSEGGRDEVAAELVRAIRRQTEEPDFAEDVPEFEFERRIRAVERGLGHLIAEKLSSAAMNWFKERVPAGIQTRVKALMQRDKSAGGAAQDYLTLGEIAIVVLRQDNWSVLEPDFTSAGFGTAQEVDFAFSTINKLRGRLTHGRAELGEADELLLNGFLRKFESIAIAAEPDDAEE